MTTRTRPRPPPRTTTTTTTRLLADAEHRDASAFYAALQPPGPQLQSVPPAANPSAGALDALLFRGVLLVTYAAGCEVIIARGTDLAVITRLAYPAAGAGAGSAAPTALAFRETDGALAAAFGSRVVVFNGWDPSSPGSLYERESVEAELDAFPVSNLSWSADGSRLAAVGGGIRVWSRTTADPNASMDPSHLVAYTPSLDVPQSACPIPTPFALGSISPDGGMLSACALHARVGWVWRVPADHSTSATPSLAEIAHGRSGAAALDWKPRGGGNPALMTVDRDATVRLWVPSLPAKGATTATAAGRLAAGSASWMEEVARSPHAEATTRAGASFVRWGGGGGCAEDEDDAAATGAAGMLAGVAPRPSRCHHWVVRVAAGNAQAWRARGLDDRPRAEYIRLEPGSGVAVPGDGPGRASLKGAAVLATRAVAPVPLTTASRAKAGVVRSYAISNGERLLRSPEPPNPPGVAAVFVLLVRAGAATVARYDVSPTSDAPAVCRARAGIGHSSPAVSLSVASSADGGTRGWLASRGAAGDVLVWRTDVTAGAREPVAVAARLPGPHAAAAFAPAGLVDGGTALLAVDAAFGALRLYPVRAAGGWRARNAIQSCAAPTVAAACLDPRAADRSVSAIVALPLKGAGGGGMEAACVVFGVSAGGSVRSWTIARQGGKQPEIARAELFVHGRRMGRATSAGAGEEGGSGKPLLVVGGEDGCVRVYRVTDARAGSADGDGEAGEVHLDEMAFLGEPDGSEAAVCEVQVSAGGTRVVATRDDSSVAVWERSFGTKAGWTVALSCDAQTDGGMPITRRGGLSADGPGCEPGVESCPIGVSTGHDHDGDLCLITSRPNGVFEVFQKPLGTAWERSGSFQTGVSEKGITKSAIAHIGPGYVAATSGRGLTVYRANFSGKKAVTFGADAAGYSPSRGLMALLLTGGEVRQTIATLEELNDYLKIAAQKTISSSTYGAGRGIVPPPAGLRMLLGGGDGRRTKREEEHASPKAFEVTSTPSKPGRSLFAQLMARSDAKMNAEGMEGLRLDLGSPGRGRDPMSVLADRIRSVSVSGISRSEETVIGAFARSVVSLRGILPSLDAGGARFALINACYRDAMPNVEVPTSVVAFAVHSSSADALMDHFLPPPKPTSLGAQRLTKTRAAVGDEKPTGMWEAARLMGAGWWVSTAEGAKKLIERIARSEFTTTRNADRAALWYVALGRNSAVAALYKAGQDVRMSKFFLRNFSMQENRRAASKNAYVLVSKHRLLLATAFFILAGDYVGALNLVKTRVKDEQLYILLARVLNGGEHLAECLEGVTGLAVAMKDCHAQAVSLWLRGKHEEALRVASEAGAADKGTQTTEMERAMGNGLPSAVFALGHTLAISERPPLRGTDTTVERVRGCRSKAARALLGDESPVASLKVTFEIAGGEEMRKVPPSGDRQSTANGSTPKDGSVCATEYVNSMHAISAAGNAIKGRAVAFAGAARSSITRRSLLALVEEDLSQLVNSCLGVEKTVEAAVAAAAELSQADEVDAAVSTALAALTIANERSAKDGRPFRRAEQSLESCLRVACSRALFHVQCAVSLLHQPATSSHVLLDVLNKTRAAVAVVERSQSFVTGIFEQLLYEFKGSVLALRFGVGFLRGEWVECLAALRSCESVWPSELAAAQSSADISVSQEFGSDDAMSGASVCSQVAADTISVEALRHMASNPAVLGMSPGLGHRRRRRKAPSMQLIDNPDASAATLGEESGGVPTLSHDAEDPMALIRIHPALSSALCASGLAYLASHLANRASKFEKPMNPRVQRKLSGGVRVSAGTREMGSFRLVDAAETLEQVANDAIAGWIPLPAFGVEAVRLSMAPPNESAGAFVDLWTTLGCLPEYAPILSEAATVAAAELAAAASKAAVDAAEVRDGGRRMRKRRERKGEKVTNIAKEGLAHLDTTADVMLHGAYPVRFSSSATGPWSGRGRHASLYKESGALFRTLCISCTDPPAVIVATPKGIQEIVPSSYTTMSAGFRTHYVSQKAKKAKRSRDLRLDALADDRRHADIATEQSRDEDFLSSFSPGFGEGPYLPLNMSQSEAPGGRPRRSSLRRNQKAVWRRQVEATALAAHPLRRRFATGGTDGFVRLWDFADPISLASLREGQMGRVAGLSFSAYGNRIMGVYASGQVCIWEDPDNYSSLDASVGRGRRRRPQTITAFDNRAASDGIFLDERHTIAVVGDPLASPATGCSLRVFDTREATSAFRASWSAHVHAGGESRCLALLEDRVRIVTGGVDGSLSVVDLRTKGCIAALPAHADEVTCLSVEWPRGRAMATGCRNGDVKVWDSRTLRELDCLPGAHAATRHFWSGSGLGGLVGSYGVGSVALTDRSLVSCGGDGVVRIWGPGWSDYDLNVL